MAAVASPPEGAAVSASALTSGFGTTTYPSAHDDGDCTWSTASVEISHRWRGRHMVSIVLDCDASLVGPMATDDHSDEEGDPATLGPSPKKGMRALSWLEADLVPIHSPSHAGADPETLSGRSHTEAAAACPVAPPAASSAAAASALAATAPPAAIPAVPDPHTAGSSGGSALSTTTAGAAAAGLLSAPAPLASNRLPTEPTNARPSHTTASANLDTLTDLECASDATDTNADADLQSVHSSLASPGRGTGTPGASPVPPAAAAAPLTAASSSAPAEGSLLASQDVSELDTLSDTDTEVDSDLDPAAEGDCESDHGQERSPAGPPGREPHAAAAPAAPIVSPDPGGVAAGGAPGGMPYVLHTVCREEAGDAAPAHHSRAFRCHLAGIADAFGDAWQPWDPASPAAQRTFSRPGRAFARAEHATLFPGNPTAAGLLHSGQDLVRLLSGGRHAAGPQRFLYVILADRLHFADVGHPALRGTTSPHAVLANAHRAVRYAGDLALVLTHGEGPGLLVSHDCATYAPSPALLPAVCALLRANLPGLRVEAAPTAPSQAPARLPSTTDRPPTPPA